MLTKELLEGQAAVELPAREMLGKTSGGGNGGTRQRNLAFIKQVAITDCSGSVNIVTACVAANSATVNQSNSTGS